MTMGTWIRELIGRKEREKVGSQSSAAHLFSILETQQMNAHIKSYLTFFAYMAVTAIVVKPLIKSLNVPLLNSLVE